MIGSRPRILPTVKPIHHRIDNSQIASRSDDRARQIRRPALPSQVAGWQLLERTPRTGKAEHWSTLKLSYAATMPCFTLMLGSRANFNANRDVLSSGL